ncbi:MAG: MotA/TolQ/ExbB proton channel family protein [Deltaproteobacteria bacterium]|nr:MotA/TolQ/ExbB proton channel family protein [Deltaproteobacteria bacterium]
MHGGGGFSLIRLFTSFAMLGAEWVMWVLVALSVASVGVMLERWAYYRSVEDDLDKLSEELRGLLRRGDREGAIARLRKSPSPAAAVALAGLQEDDAGLKSVEEAMAGAVARQRMILERRLAFLGTVGNNAPFVGLFGTVIGIIQAFDKLRETEQAAREAARRAAQGGGAIAAGLDTGAVMGTLAEALVATAIGLLVAIPAVAAFNYFQRKVKGLLASTEGVTHVVNASLAALTPELHGVYRARSERKPEHHAQSKSDKADKGVETTTREEARDPKEAPATVAAEKA